MMNESSQRVSYEMGKTKDAHTSRCSAPRSIGRDRKSHEQVSGKDADRLQLNLLKQDVQPKDTISVERITRVGLNVDDQTGRPNTYVQKDVYMSRYEGEESLSGTA